MRQAMIFAAGMGTRLKPITDTMPKALVRVGGRPLIDWVLSRLHAKGFNRFVVNVHHFAEQIVDYIDGNELYRSMVTISDESEQLLETGGGLKKAAPLFDDDTPILIHNVDILSNVDYDWFYRQHLEDEDAVLLVSRRKTTRYLLFDNAMRLMGWINTQTGEIRSPYEWIKHPDDADIDAEKYMLNIVRGTTPISLNMFAFTGIHTISPRLFKLMDKFPERFGIIDFYLQTCHRTHIYGCTRENLQMLDVGKLNSLEEAEKFVI